MHCPPETLHVLLPSVNKAIIALIFKHQMEKTESNLPIILMSN